MIAALSAADQRRRRTDPVETATPRSSHFASLLPSNITITRSSPLLQAKQASQPLPLKKGARTPLTKHRTSRYLNNRVEQDHRGIKGRYRPMRGFKCVRSAARFCRVYDELRNFLRPAPIIVSPSLPITAACMSSVLPQRRSAFWQPRNPASP